MLCSYLTVVLVLISTLCWENPCLAPVWVQSHLQCSQHELGFYEKDFYLKSEDKGGFLTCSASDFFISGTWHIYLYLQIYLAAVFCPPCTTAFRFCIFIPLQHLVTLHNYSGLHNYCSRWILPPCTIIQVCTINVQDGFNPPARLLGSTRLLGYKEYMFIRDTRVSSIPI